MYTRLKWPTLWGALHNHKLYNIQPIVALGKYKFSGKREKFELARAHIGHWYITHSYLLKGDQMPECIPCYPALTVKHIWIQCVDFMDVSKIFLSLENPLWARCELQSKWDCWYYSQSNISISRIYLSNNKYCHRYHDNNCVKKTKIDNIFVVDT